MEMVVRVKGCRLGLTEFVVCLGDISIMIDVGDIPAGPDTLRVRDKSPARCNCCSGPNIIRCH
jgi:hypothetical protein